MIAILEKHFNLQLTAFGYDDIVLEDGLSWQLNYSQADGLKFPYATLHSTSIHELSDRLLKGKTKAAVTRAIKKGLEISIGGAFPAHLEEYHCSPELTNVEREACEDFILLIDKDLHDLERQLTSDGYAILDSTPSEFEPETAIKRDLGRFQLIVKKTHCGSFSIVDDDEYFLNDMKSIINKEAEYFDLQILLLDRQNNNSKLNTRYLGSCSIGPTESIIKAYGCYIREMVAEMVDEARTNLNLRNVKRDKQMRDKIEADRLLLQKRAAEARAEKDRIKQDKLNAQILSIWQGITLNSQSAFAGV